MVAQVVSSLQDLRIKLTVYAYFSSAWVSHLPSHHPDDITNIVKCTSYEISPGIIFSSLLLFLSLRTKYSPQHIVLS
jgi:hypothetical protein